MSQPLQWHSNWTDVVKTLSGGYAGMQIPAHKAHKEENAGQKSLTPSSSRKSGREVQQACSLAPRAVGGGGGGLYQCLC